MAMFGRFTERAQRVIYLAQEEAGEFYHDYIGTEHILLGLVKEGEGVAANVLDNMGVDLEELRDQILDIIGEGDEPAKVLGLTPRTKRVFELSFEEARKFGQNYVGTEHLLLGLIREGEGVAAAILRNSGIDLEQTRTEILNRLNQNYGVGGQPASKRNKSNRYNCNNGNSCKRNSRFYEKKSNSSRRWKDSKR